MDSLYEIKNEYLEAFSNIHINDETGEVEGLEKLKELKGNLDEKVENTVLWIKSQEALAESIKKEEGSFKARRETIERKVERTKDFLRSVLIEADMRKFETARAKVSFRSSTSVCIVNKEAIPSEYKVVETAINIRKGAIREAIKNGVVVPGAELVSKENIQIK